MFDIQATAYVGQSGRTALGFEAEYDLLLTQRLVMQPDVKVTLYGKNDPKRGIGAGLSDETQAREMPWPISATRKLS